MSRVNLRVLGTLLLAAPVLGSVASAQESGVVGYSIGSSRQTASLEFQLANGKSLAIALAGGTVQINGQPTGHYTPGGPLEQAWRTLLAGSADRSTDAMIAAVRAWKPSALSGQDAQAFAALHATVSSLKTAAGTPATAPVVAASVGASSATVTSGATASAAPAPVVVDGDAIRQSVRAALEAARQETRVAREQVRAGREMPGHFPMARVSAVSTVGGGLLALLGALVGLAGIAFGISFFAERQLDVIADTVSTSFGRSFFVGLFAQPLIVPAFAMMVVGLALTVVGIIVIPVAAVGFILTLMAAIVGGYLAIARVAGGAFLARRGAKPDHTGFGTLRAVALGLLMALGVWLPAVLLRPIPVAGPIVWWTAVVLTWVLATAGFGATLLTRGGARATFGRRYRPVIAEEALWLQTTEPVEDEELTVSTGEWLKGGGTP